jgi:transglutaminase-like putative cysteine protease
MVCGPSSADDSVRTTIVKLWGRRYRILHRTTYHYEVPMIDGYTVAHLLPRATDRQRIHAAHLEITPEPSEYDEFADLFGNRVVQFGVHQPHSQLVVDAWSEVELFEPPAVDPGPAWEEVVQLLRDINGDTALEVAPFSGSSQFVDLDGFGTELSEIALTAFLPGRPIVDATAALCSLIFTEFVFDPTATDVSTPLAQVLKDRRGVCQDFAHLAAGCLRSIGLACRYVSGYLETEPPDGMPRLVGADLSHAWASVWTPHAGWVDFDPTNGHLPTERHLSVGWGRDFADVSPVRGVVIGPTSGQSLQVSVDVVPVDPVESIPSRYPKGSDVDG